MEANKETEQNIGAYFDEEKEKLLGFFIKKTGDKDKAEDLLGELFEKFVTAVYKKPRPKKDYPKLKTLIERAVLNDYYRKSIRRPKGQYKLDPKGFYNWAEPEKKKWQKQKDISLDIILKDDRSKEPGENDREIEKIKTSWKKELKIFQLRKILLSEHRSLQEAAILCLATNIKKLKNKIKKEFKFAVGRYQKRGLGYKIIQRNEADKSDEINEMFYNFSIILFDIAKKLNIDDEIGIKALEILLLSSNPINDWFRLSLSIKKTYYLALNKNGVYKKSTIKRPYKNLFRDYVIYICKAEGLEEILWNKQIKLDVANDYIKNLYKIGSIKANTINKQIGGRVNAPGLKSKIENYEGAIEQIIQGL